MEEREGECEDGTWEEDTGEELEDWWPQAEDAEADGDGSSWDDNEEDTGDGTWTADGEWDEGEGEWNDTDADPNGGDAEWNNNDNADAWNDVGGGASHHQGPYLDENGAWNGGNDDAVAETDDAPATEVAALEVDGDDDANVDDEKSETVTYDENDSSIFGTKAWWDTYNSWILGGTEVPASIPKNLVQLHSEQRMQEVQQQTVLMYREHRLKDVEANLRVLERDPKGKGNQKKLADVEREIFKLAEEEDTAAEEVTTPTADEAFAIRKKQALALMVVQRNARALRKNMNDASEKRSPVPGTRSGKGASSAAGPPRKGPARAATANRNGKGPTKALGRNQRNGCHLSKHV